VKTIGILGGISPQATMDFERRVHEVSQRLIPQRGNSGYPPMLVYYHRRPPVLTRDGIEAIFPIQADPELLEAARWLGSKADFLVITANSAHVLQKELEEASTLKILSMIEETLSEVKQRGWKKIGLLGLQRQVSIYSEPLSQLGLACEIIDDELQGRLVADIKALMEGAKTHQTAEEALEVLRHREVDGIILGCTEIPLLLGDKVNERDLISPIVLLAEAAVKFAAG
jgi:aspartate racemase